MSQCQAYAHRYVGKGKDRVKYEGPCVLEPRGHDGECLPAALAYANTGIQSYNAGVTEALAKAMYVLGGRGHGEDGRPDQVDLETANLVKETVEGLIKELIL